MSRIPRSSLLLAILLPLSLQAASTYTHTTKPITPPPPSALAENKNPLLPPPISLDSLYPDLALLQKSPSLPPPGYDPIYSPQDYQSYRQNFGSIADTLPKLKSSVLLDFSQKLLTASQAPSAPPSHQRLLLLRAAITSFRTRNGFPIANNALLAYQKVMNIHSPTQVAALWTLANAISRTIATPKPDRIHYSAIAAKANMQLTLLLLDRDQLAAAQSLQKQIAYHEGWLHTLGATPEDKALRPQIAQVRNLVKQTTITLDFLATQYEPAIHGDDSALMAIYLYGRYVKNNPAIVADLPARKPNSPLSQLAAALDAVQRGDPTAPYTAAETLRIVASTLPEPGAGVLKQRTLYAALQNYRIFINDPRTEKDRIKRTLARMAIESTLSDGARGPSPIVNPFAPPSLPTTQPTATPSTQTTPLN